MSILESSKLARAGARAALSLLAVYGVAAAQEPPVRQIGALERVSSDSTLLSIASAIAMPGGRVLVNDRIGRRVVLFDSTLAHEAVVADTTSATGAAYGRRPDNLIHFRGDSALLIDGPSLSMYVIGPAGTIARVMAIPRGEDADALLQGAGIDANGRLVYFNALGKQPGATILGVGDAIYRDGQPTSLARFNMQVDSAPLVRFDLQARGLDTIANLAIAKLRRELKTDAGGGLTSIETTYDPMPLVDAWAMTSDGSVAVLRARDFHMEWVNAAGQRTSSLKMPFDWQRVDDARKRAAIDSTTARWQGQLDRIMNGGGRGATGVAPLVALRADPATLPDYAPPINDRPGALTGDADGNVWIRTTTIVAGQPVYDVVNRKGELAGRVQLPAFRTIAGFGPGVIYMAVKDSAGVVRLERARIH